MEYYDKSYDRVNVKNERPLVPIDRIHHTVTTSDDPIIRKVCLVLVHFNFYILRKSLYLTLRYGIEFDHPKFHTISWYKFWTWSLC